MTYQEIKPSTPHHIIDTVWYADSADVGVGYAVAPELGANLVIKLFADQSEVMLSGPVTRQQHYPYIPDTQYFGIRFHRGCTLPENLASLYELHNTSITIPPNILIQWDCLAERLCEKQSLQDQFALLHQHSINFFDLSADIPPTVREALDHIHCRRGVVRVSDLTELTMVSERQLERLFKAYLGLSPKTFCNTVRIRRILEILWQSTEKPLLTDLALQFGYADQSHLANDFRHVMGMSISDYMRG